MNKKTKNILSKIFYVIIILSIFLLIWIFYTAIFYIPLKEKDTINESYDAGCRYIPTLEDLQRNFSVIPKNP